MKENFKCGKLTTVQKVSKGKREGNKKSYWLCRCECGGEKIVNESALYNGSTRSCGCLGKKNDEDYNRQMKMKIKQRIEIDPNGCWLWQGSKHRQGYGTIGYRGKPHLTHRISWLVFNGEIPDKIKVCHKCDITNCCNPDHLFLGSQKENMKDAFDKNRMDGRKLGKRRNKLNYEQVQEIKMLKSSGCSWKYLQEKFNVSQTCIAKILRGDSWKTNWTQEQ